MSIQNILSQNDYSAFLENLTINDTLTVENITVQNVNIETLEVSTLLEIENGGSLQVDPGASINVLGGGQIVIESGADININDGGNVALALGSSVTADSSTINFNSGTDINYKSGSATTYANGCTLTCNNTPVFSNNISVPSVFYFNNNIFGSLNLYYTATLGVLGSLIGTTSINFFNIGSIKALQISGFRYNQGTNGFYQIDITSASNYYFPSNGMEFLVPVVNGDGNIQTGAFFTDTISGSKYLQLMYDPDGNPFVAYVSAESGLLNTSYIFY